jgi:hypothetical protein
MTFDFNIHAVPITETVEQPVNRFPQVCLIWLAFCVKPDADKQAILLAL